MLDNRIGKIILNKKIAPDYNLMEIKACEIAKRGKAGQFVHIKVNKSRKVYDPLLRRPFSFYDIDNKKGIIKIVYKILGRGTKILSEFKKNEIINVLGPLGNGFGLKESQEKIVLIGGGMGIVPLYMLSKQLKSNNLDFKVLIGGSTKNTIQFFIKEFKKLGVNLFLATMDGSIGYKGTVIDLFKQNEFDNNYIYSCGPKLMLKELMKISKNNKLKGQVSLEERMGCGTGICLSCVCQTVEGNKRVCKDGPVFKLDEVVYDE
ncbi:MAG: dihydroorotate dehydrogenase electron transfer subunit [Bacillota bacterium]